MMDPEHSDRSRAEFFHRVAGRQPRGLLLKAASRFQAPGSAIDLGCGGGIETIALLEQGWQVLAIDQQIEAIQSLRTNLPARLKARLTTRIRSFNEIELPPADLVWAGISLPFCPPQMFEQLWEQIDRALVPGGWFAGDLFGDRHPWAVNDTLTFHNAADVSRLFENYEVEELTEEWNEAQPGEVPPLHWFRILARKKWAE